MKGSNKVNFINIKMNKCLKSQFGHLIFIPTNIYLNILIVVNTIIKGMSINNFLSFFVLCIYNIFFEYKFFNKGFHKCFSFFSIGSQLFFKGHQPFLIFTFILINFTSNRIKFSISWMLMFFDSNLILFLF